MKKKLPTKEYLDSILKYIDGKLFWKKSLGNQVKIGDIAGSKTINDYRVIIIDNITYAEHRIIWKMLNGVDPNGQIDHINHIRDDNKIENLRDVPKTINMQNISKQKNNSSGYSNIFIWQDGREKKYSVQIRSVNGKYTKGFSSLDEAIQNRDEMYNKLGFHENHGK